MSKSRFAALSLLVPIMLTMQLAGFDRANGAIVDPCRSTASGPAGVVLACPQSDGDALNSLGLTITLTVRDRLNQPIPGVPATDIWLIGCDFALPLCGGSSAINASAPTNVIGQTTITGDIAAGGCNLAGVRVVVQGLVIGGAGCGQPCIPIKVLSPDINGNLNVTVADMAMFAVGFPIPPKPFEPCLAFAAPHTEVNLASFARFAAHFTHRCY
jgi:hypothetical protein